MNEYEHKCNLCGSKLPLDMTQISVYTRYGWKLFCLKHEGSIQVHDYIETCGGAIPYDISPIS